MKCRKAIRQLPAYLDRELSRHEVNELERHLKVCVFCSTELSALRATAKLLDTWEDTSPRRSYVNGVISRIASEEAGFAEATSGIGTRFLHGRWLPGMVRAIAAIVFVVGAAVYSGYPPVEKAGNRIALEKAPYPNPAKVLIPLNEDLLRSYIQPTEYALLLRGMENRGRVVGTSGILAGPRQEGAFPSRGSGGFLNVNHTYFPDEDMRLDSVIPLESP